MNLSQLESQFAQLIARLEENDRRASQRAEDERIAADHRQAVLRRLLARQLEHEDAMRGAGSAELTRHFQSLQATLGEQADVRRALDAARSDLDAARGDLEALRQAGIAERADARRVLDDANTEADAARRYAEALGQELVRLQSHAEKAEAEIKALIHAGTAQQADAKRMLEAARHETDAARRHAEALGQELVRLQSHAEKAEAEIKALIDAGTAQQADAKRMLEAARHETDAARLQLEAVGQEVGRWRARAQRAESEIQALAASSSWRITRPIRVAKRLMTTGHLRAPRPDPKTSAGLTAPSGPRPAEQLSPQTVAQTNASSAASAQKSSDIRLIAFYLPQFHAIPENDAWWGDGFTEWTNTRRAQPQFVGHYQPHEPADLGYYDLRDPAVQQRQVELAKSYSVGGFCFYFYWFAGKRLLEEPIRLFAENDDIDFPFCLCWANENWSRRWDGLDHEVLIAQAHSPEDDIAFITHLSTYLHHRSYIRVNGKPLVMVYRPALLPDAKATAQRWRAYCREHGVGEIHLAYTQSFEAVDPAEYGFDAAVEFPPNNTAPPVITDTVERLNPAFDGVVYDYRVYPARSTRYARPGYPLYRGVFPSWDNEARRTGRGATFLHAAPDLYQRWLTNAARDTIQRFQRPDERLVFVNAWNEWAEGAHLEPDVRHGHAYLQATRDALTDATAAGSLRRLVLVGHDAYRHGAQYLALNLARVLSEDFGYALDIVILGDGPMKVDYARYGVVHDLAGVDPLGSEAKSLAQALVDRGATAALCNTTVSGLFLNTLSRAGLRCVSLVHEMEGLIRSYGLERQAQLICERADKIIFASQQVADNFARIVAPPTEKTTIRTQGLYKLNGARDAAARHEARKRLCAHFKLSPDAEVVIGVGYGDHRKGVDLFADVGLHVMAARRNAVFIWVGALEASIEPLVHETIENAGLADRFFFVGFQAQTDDFYAGADIYALTSREDPFPTVLMEAMDVELPVVAFEGAGGFEDLLAAGCGELVAAGDVRAMARSIAGLLEQPARRRAMGALGKARADWDYNFRRYVSDVVHWLEPSRLRISVVVPNYNYARFLDQRLGSIDAQSLAPHELILLDDASTDDSVALAQKLLPTLHTPSRLIVNSANSGSVFRQWLKAVEAAEGDLVWIAEADDLASPGFLQAAVAPFADPTVVLSFCQSKQMAHDGAILCEDYLDYTRDVDPTRWSQAYVADGMVEITQALAIKNTIPNVSAAVFRRDVLLQVLRQGLDEIVALRVAGDWATYLKVLEHGRVAFSPESLNFHRRHPESVTLAAFDSSQLVEILSVQQSVRRRHKVPPHVANRAKDYAQSLYRQFGLDADGEASIQDNPLFAAFLD